MSARPSMARRGKGDDGVALILFAMLLVGILLLVALVIDMSDLRNSRQDNKLITDVAAAAGAQSLGPDGVAKPWRGACAALTFLKANQPSLVFNVTYRDGAGTPVSGSPCTDRLAQFCQASTPTSWAWIRATAGSVVADIKTGYVTPDPAFAEDTAAYAGDNGLASAGGCDQLAVIMSQQDAALFGGVAGRSSYSSTGRSVARVAVGTEGEGAPAFLMLERKSCDVLSQAVGAGGGEGIIVEPASATEPGIIHLDTSATGPSCSGGGASAYGLYSGTIGSNPGVIAKPAGATIGIISLRALDTNPGQAWATASGVSPTPTRGKLISRKSIDDKYNPESPYAPTIANIHAAAYADAIRTVAPAGYTTVSTCSGDMTLANTLIFVNCPGGFTPGSVTFSAATHVIFNGPVEVKGGKSLFMPAARRIVVGGNTTRGLEVANNGRIGVNSASFADTAAGVSSACDGREGPAWTQTTQMTIFGGSGNVGLGVTGRGALCQTFVYLAGPKVAGNATYTRQAITDGSYDSTCTAAKPCPKLTSNSAVDAGFNVAGFLKWSAPNQLTTQPVYGAVGVEDLALWTETASLSEVKAGGVLASRGVFFLPNGRAEMRSPASATPQDAQFIAQSLRLLQGTMQMQPSPANAVQIPVLKSVGMVR